jgi:imidazolonepropionase-like amidohydrolase
MRSFYFTIALILSVFSSIAQKTLIHCGNLIDPAAGKVLREMTIQVEGNKIISVNAGFTKPEKDDKVVDLRSKTVMPGLIDMHVHLEEEISKSRYSDMTQLNPADFAFHSTVFAQRTLMQGFTTVRDLGGTGVNISLRKAIASGYVIGPRVFTCGKIISTTGGHGDPTNGLNKVFMGDPGPNDGVVNGPDEARKAVRQRYKEGSDLIKITATGGVLSNAKDGSGPQFTEEEIRAIVSTAKDYGFRVAAHAHGAEGIKRAARAGVNSIEHGSYIDDEAIAIMKEQGTWLVPTLTAGRSVADSAKIPGFFPPLVVPKAIAVSSRIQESFSRAYKAGVKIAFGTDAAVYAHGKNYLEFQYMVEGGMSPMETIKAATTSAADLLDQKENLGAIEKGKLADIIAVDGDPIKDVRSMKDVVFVMKDGKIYKQ